MKKAMKRIVALLLTLVLLLPATLICVSATEEGGTGTVTPKYEVNKGWWLNRYDEDVYEVATPEDLLAVAYKRGFLQNYKDKTIKLVADIDLNPGWDAASGTVPPNVWTSMFRFDGNIDGNGHTIKGLYSTGDANGNNASFITNLVGSKIMNLKIENSYFGGTGNNAAVFACVKNDSTLENVYVDAIVEAGGIAAGGLISWHFTSATGELPKSTVSNCVFAGSVKAKLVAGGIIGITASYDESSKTAVSVTKAYETIVTDCANYGTVTTPTGGLYTGGIIGYAAAKTTVSRCYNGGTVSGAEENAGILNVVLKTNAEVLVEDCYFLAATDLVGMSKNTLASSVAPKYDGTNAETIATATVEEVLAKNAFKEKWSLKSELAMPAGVLPLLQTHTYEAIVTPPTCTEKGYTTYTCKDEGCDSSYVSDYTEMIDHVAADEWIVDKEPTTESAGSRHKVCTMCGNTVKQEVLKKLPAETSANTEAPQQTQEPATEAAPDEEKKEGGCGASIAAGAALGLTVLLSLGVVSVRRKKD